MNLEMHLSNRSPCKGTSSNGIVLTVIIAGTAERDKEGGKMQTMQRVESRNEKERRNAWKTLGFIIGRI